MADTNTKSQILSDVTYLNTLKTGNTRVSQLNLNNKVYEIWDGTAREVIGEIITNLNFLTGDAEFNEVIPKVKQIYTELQNYADNGGMADSVIDTLFNKFDADGKANYAKRADFADVAGKLGNLSNDGNTVTLTGAGGPTNPVYFLNGVPTAVTYATANGGPTADATLTHSGTFVVPQVSQAAGGQVTVTNRTMTLPAAQTWTAVTGDPADSSETTTLSHGGTFTIPRVAQATNGQVTVTGKTFKLPTCLTTSIAAAATADTNKITLAHGTKYKLTAGDSSFVFTMPAGQTWTAASGGPTTGGSLTHGDSLIVPYVTQATNGQVTVTDKTFTLPVAQTWTAASGGPTDGATLTHGGSFTVPHVAQATDGQVTVTDKTFKLPAAQTWTAASGGPTDGATLKHGDSFTIPHVAQATNGQVTVTGKTFTLPTCLTTSIAAAASADTNKLTLAHGTKYKLTAGDSSFVFTMPGAQSWTAASGGPTADATLNSGVSFKVPYVEQATNGQVTVTEKTMTMPTLLSIGTTADTAAKGNHTHTTTIAKDTTSSTSALTLANGSKYKLTAGGTSFIFTMPAAQSIPTVNDAKLTINADNSTKVEFTANQSTAVTKAVSGSLYTIDEPDEDNGHTLTLGVKIQFS